MTQFDDLVTWRKTWINEVLKPWCLAASRSELLKAEVEWLDIAGKVSPETTLWRWAWSRFPGLVHENLGIDETSEVEVTLKDGRTFTGFPESRKSQRGNLVIWGQSPDMPQSGEIGPFSIDQIESVNRSAV